MCVCTCLFVVTNLKFIGRIKQYFPKISLEYCKKIYYFLCLISFISNIGIDVNKSHNNLKGSFRALYPARVPFGQALL